VNNVGAFWLFYAFCQLVFLAFSLFWLFVVFLRFGFFWLFGFFLFFDKKKR